MLLWMYVVMAVAGWLLYMATYETDGSFAVEDRVMTGFLSFFACWFWPLILSVWLLRRWLIASGLMFRFNPKWRARERQRQHEVHHV